MASFFFRIPRKLITQDMAPPRNRVQDISDEIIKGIQDGSMAVMNIEARWDKNFTQTYILEVVDMKRSSRLAQMASAAPTAGHPAAGFPAPVIPKWSFQAETPIDMPIKDLGVITEPVVGFRDFYFGMGASWPHPGLVSRNKAPWPMREPMHAFCKGNALAQHDAPAIGCECGIYAFSSPKDSGLLTGAVIWGEIAMWGEVLIAPQGYRSEFAYPKTLFIQDTGATKSVRWTRDLLADGYGVPVFIVEKKQGKTASEIISEMIEAGL